MITFYFDGACWPNPGGPMGIGVMIQKYKTLTDFDNEAYYEGFPAGDTSNNVAEYKALKWVLNYIRDRPELHTENIEVYGDSDLVVKQMYGVWRIKAGIYSDDAKECLRLFTALPRVIIIWIPREENGEADALSMKGLELYGTYKVKNKKKRKKII